MIYTAAIPDITCPTYKDSGRGFQMTSVLRTEIVVPETTHEIEEFFIDKTSINGGLQAQSVWMSRVLMEAAKIVKEPLSLGVSGLKPSSFMISFICMPGRALPRS